ncbi:adenine deaminase [uncultured Winogradskyella sp.]|uniref:adenine deaminase n=1 Tax=uncultured Winogradskyella sp. TaxID=395353 RepID=UPI00260911FA|nr:adenine deaminase [uncultured Winogradskyella sp.]
MKLKGNIVDIKNRKIFKGEVTLENGKITSIIEKDCEENHYILPGFVDAHIHIESSMLVPSEFAKVAVKHGTVATVSDPHEIANVLGVKGVEFMINNGKQTPFKFNFGAPSCVPATSFESAGAVINSDDIQTLMANPDIKYLAEMMNYPGVIYDNAEVLKKLNWAKHYNKPIDGHAPGLRGDDLTKYIAAGISTDHECFTYEEGLEKLQKGMKVIIREGSAAKNFDALIDLLDTYYKNMMFCSDDKHPDDLLLGHINQLCIRAVEKGIDVFKVLQAACINPVKHYNLDVGLLNVGDQADMIVIENLKDFKTLQTYIDGELVYDKGVSNIKHVEFKSLNNFNAQPKSVGDFRLEARAELSGAVTRNASEVSKSIKPHSIRVIECLDGELITNNITASATIKDGNLVSNTETDILKMVVVNRYDAETYKEDKPAIAFIKNFGLKEGAIASSVGHDSHNIIAVGVSDEAICKAVNLLIDNEGGICAVSNQSQNVIPLPVAGIMSDQNAETIGKQYAQLDKMAKQMGSPLNAPYMSLSFMALLVIPSLKLSDKGLFDGAKFQFTSVQM